MKHSSFIQYALVAILLFSLPPTVSAQQQSINVVTEEWAPYNYIENGSITGVMTEVVRATLNRAGIDFNITVLPWARAYHTAQNEKNTLIYTIFKLDSRVDDFQWIQIDGLSTEMYLFSDNTQSTIHLETLDDARDLRIGVTRATSTHHFLQNRGFIESKNLFPVSSERQNIRQLANDRIDLTTGDLLSLSHWLHTEGYSDNYLKSILFLFREDFYMAFSKSTSPIIVEKVSRAYNAIKEDGTLASILDRYYHRYALTHQHPIATLPDPLPKD